MKEYLLWECKSRKEWGLEPIEPKNRFCKYRLNDQCVIVTCNGFLPDQEIRDQTKLLEIGVFEK